MKKQVFTLLAATFLIISLSGCDHIKNKLNKLGIGDNEDSTEAVEIEEKVNNDDDMIEAVVNDWNNSLNLRDTELARKVYAPSVFFYTRDLPAEEGIKLRQDMVVSDPSYNQNIISDIRIEENPDGSKTAYFTKQVSNKKGVNTYRSYLVLNKINDKWKIIKESDDLTDKNVSKKKVKIPDDAVRGDFDGDGRIDNVWIEAKYDSDGYAKTRLRLVSDNSSLEGLSWNEGLMGVVLVNLGDLNGSNRDFLGAIPYSHSNWCVFETYGFKNNNWKNVLDNFQVWLGDENLQRVFRADKPGYVFINYNDMEDVDDFSTKQKQARLKF